MVVPIEDRTLGELDPPNHTLVRRVMVTALTPSSVKGAEPYIAAMAESLLAALPDAGEVDLVATFTSPLPNASTVHEPAGAPEVDQDEEQVEQPVAMGRRVQARVGPAVIGDGVDDAGELPRPETSGPSVPGPAALRQPAVGSLGIEPDPLASRAGLTDCASGRWLCGTAGRALK